MVRTRLAVHMRANWGGKHNRKPRERNVIGMKTGTRMG